MEKLGRPKTETSNDIWVEIDNFLREHEQEIADDCKKIMKTVRKNNGNWVENQDKISKLKQLANKWLKKLSKTIDINKKEYTRSIPSERFVRAKVERFIEKNIKDF